MTTVLLMDNVLTSSGGMVSGCEGRLLKKGIRCVTDGGRVTPTGPVILDLDEMADRLVKLVKKHSVEAVVMDIDWGTTVSFDGFSIWARAIERGLVLPESRVVFLTQHRQHTRAHQEVSFLGISPQQIQYKNEQGNDAAAAWIFLQLGIDFK